MGGGSNPMVSWWTVAMVALFFLSGCASSVKDSSSGELPDSASPSTGLQPGVFGSHETSAPGGSAGGAGNGGGASSGPTPPRGSQNHVPIVIFTASVQQARPPVDVVFHVLISDEDDDPVAWRLDFGDIADSVSGTATNFTVTHLYRHDGNYTAHLEVGDGRSASVNESLTITLFNGLGKVTESEDVLNDCSQFCENCEYFLGNCVCNDFLGASNIICENPDAPANYTAPGAYACSSFAGGEQSKGGDCTWFALPDTAVGLPMVVTSDAGNPDIEFWTGCSRTGSSRIGINWEPGAEQISAIPRGTRCIIAYEASFAPGGATITMTYG